MDKKDYINKKYNYAIIGATTNKEKYGYRVMMDLQRGGYKVVGVNPKYEEIDGIKVYPSINDIPDKPDVAVVVIPADASLKILSEIKEAGINKLWFQPGAENEELRKKCEELDINCMANGACIMIERRYLFDKLDKT